MKEELKPCPFCGKKGRIGIYGDEPENNISCGCTGELGFNRDEWQNAYCWKEIAAFRAENTELQKKLNYRNGDVERSEAQINHLREKVLSQSQQIESLQLSERRSKATIGELVEALKDFRSHGVRHDLNPTGMFHQKCGHFTVWENNGGWNAYLKSADAYVRGKAQDVLRSVEQSESNGSVSDKGEKC